jgi:hypothetical protein
MICDRCDQHMMSSIMSRFNTDIICSVCEVKEKAHPNYQLARDTEHRAVVNGNYNFPGIGKPADL